MGNKVDSLIISRPSEIIGVGEKRCNLRWLHAKRHPQRISDFCRFQTGVEEIFREVKKKGVLSTTGGEPQKVEQKIREVCE